MSMLLFADVTEVREIAQDYDARDLGDDATAHRWRAWWRQGYSDLGVNGIVLRAYPVIRATPVGAWIDTDATRQATKQPWEEGAPALEWTKGNWHKTRWVSNTSGAAWAKTTREAAIYSLAVRLDRWATNIAREARRAKQAADVMAELRPDLARFSDRANWSLRSAGE